MGGPSLRSICWPLGRVEAAKKGNPCHPREGPASSPQHPYTSLEAIPGLTESGRDEDAPCSGVVRAKTSQHELLESLRACDGIEGGHLPPGPGNSVLTSGSEEAAERGENTTQGSSQRN